jgi:hypothetical protein
VYEDSALTLSEIWVRKKKLNAKVKEELLDLLLVYKDNVQGAIYFEFINEIRR